MTKHEIVQNLPDGSSTPESTEGAVLVKRGGRWVPESLAELAATAAHDRDQAAHGSNPLFAAIRRNLIRGGDQTIVILGDSTTNERGDWGGRFADFLAAAYPSHCVRLSLWDAASMAWGDSTTIQSGASGEPGLARTGASSGIRLPHSVFPTPTSGTVELIVDMTNSAWGAAQHIWLDKGATNGNRGVRFMLNSGRFYFQWSTTGATLDGAWNWPLPAWAAGSRNKLKFTFNLGTGVASLSYWNGSAWALIGGNTVGAATVHNGAEDWILNNPGTVYELSMKIDGRNYFPIGLHNWRFEAATANPASYAWLGSPELVVLSGGHAGAYLDTWTDTTRIAAALGKYRDTNGIIVALGLNGGYSHGDEYATALDAFYASAKTKTNAGFCFLGVNPKGSTADYIRQHEIRLSELPGWCARNSATHYSVTDAFLADSRGVDALLLDGIHPNADGYALYGQTVAAPLLP